jgi:iron complex outermembrane receptor protein
MKRVSIILLMCLAFCRAVSAATTLPEVVVTADTEKSSLVSQSADKAQKELSGVPGGVSIVRMQDVKQGRSSTPQDLLGWVPGVFVQQRDTAAQESRISIRGSGLQRTFHLRGILLLQDGIPLNQADGGGDAQRIEPLATDYTEVYRGGNALRYGATTLGGAINFVSPTGYTADLFQSRLEIGSHNYIRSQISSGQVLGPFDYYLSATQFNQMGFRNHAEQDNYDLFSNFGWRINDQTETRFYVTYVEAKAKLGGSLLKNQLYSDPTQARLSNVTGNNKRDFNFMRLVNKTTIENGDQRLDLTGYWFTIDLFHPIFNVLDIESNDFGGEARYTNEADLFGRPNELVAGFSTSIGYADDDRSTNIGGERGVKTGELDQFAQNFVFYAEDAWRAFEALPNLALVAGVQLVYSARDVQDYFFPNGDDSGRKTYHSVNPKAGLLYDLTERTQAFVNYHKTFEPPSFSEMTNLAGDFLPNKAQIGNTVEAGTRGEEGPVEWEAVYYRTWLDNELLSLNDGFGNPLGTINATSETIHQGVEFGAKITWDRIWARGVYTWSDFYFNGDPVFGKNQLPGFPEHFFRGELVYEHPWGIYGGVNVEGTISKYPIDMANSVYADTYTIWGVKMGYRTKKGVSFFFEGKNLADTVYAASTGLVADARGRDTSAVFNPGSGRAWYGGVEFKW